MQVKESTFLITGAASGLGAATAERLVAAGARVVLCDLNDSVERHAEQLGGGRKRAWRTSPLPNKCSRQSTQRWRWVVSMGFPEWFTVQAW